ncbi:unnamed protein product, partial [Cyprideis torosa]
EKRELVDLILTLQSVGQSSWFTPHSSARHADMSPSQARSAPYAHTYTAGERQDRIYSRHGDGRSGGQRGRHSANDTDGIRVRGYSPIDEGSTPQRPPNQGSASPSPSSEGPGSRHQSSSPKTSPPSQRRGPTEGLPSSAPRRSPTPEAVEDPNRKGRCDGLTSDVQADVQSIGEMRCLL